MLNKETSEHGGRDKGYFELCFVAEPERNIFVLISPLMVDFFNRESKEFQLKYQHPFLTRVIFFLNEVWLNPFVYVINVFLGVQIDVQAVIACKGKCKYV